VIVSSLDRAQESIACDTDESGTNLNNFRGKFKLHFYYNGRGVVFISLQFVVANGRKRLGRPLKRILVETEAGLSSLTFAIPKCLTYI